jgi:molybdate transport system substrate-binding protein
VIRIVLLVLLLGCAPRGTPATPVRILVAANFRDCLQELADAYAGRTDQAFTISSGATGQLYAQIVAGAPCDLFFAADRERPQRLVAAGRVAPDDCRTYAVGQLALVGLGDSIQTGGAFAAMTEHALADPHAKLAIANPDLAPYGRAARQALEARGLWQRVQPQLVRGQNVNQAWQFVRTGAARVGLVSVAQLVAAERAGEARVLGTRFRVPADLHEAIVQQVAVLDDAPAAAREFLAFVFGPDGERIRLEFGYGVAPE